LLPDGIYDETEAGFRKVFSGDMTIWHVIKLVKYGTKTDLYVDNDLVIANLPSSSYIDSVRVGFGDGTSVHGNISHFLWDYVRYKIDN